MHNTSFGILFSFRCVFLYRQLCWFEAHRYGRLPNFRIS